VSLQLANSAASRIGMGRKDKEIQSRREIDAIIRGCQVCHLAFAEEQAI
jgi:nitroimidazol reductase NimA-like FMN-containing flavoprotein (pyridoxamine 5'-phosphate oxidase superfamily)